MAAFRRLRFLEVGTFNCETVFRGLLCVILPNFVAVCQTVAQIYELVQYGGRPPPWICFARVWNHPQRAFGGRYYYAKFGWNRCSRFDIINVLTFREFGWMDQDAKCYGGRPRLRPHCVRWGLSSPKMGAQQPPPFDSGIVAKRLDGARCHLVRNRPQPRSHCVRWGPSSPPIKGS